MSDKNKKLIETAADWLADFLAKGKVVKISAELKGKIRAAVIKILTESKEDLSQKLESFGNGALYRTSMQLHQQCGVDVAKNFPDNFSAVVNLGLGKFRVITHGNVQCIYPPGDKILKQTEEPTKRAKVRKPKAKELE